MLTKKIAIGRIKYEIYQRREYKIMNGSGKTVKLSIMLILMIALMFSTAFMMIIKATEDKEDAKNAKYDGDYTIEYLIRHFNLVTLKDVSQAEHIVGPVLIGGDVKDKLYHSQVTGNISSYIKGKIEPGGNVENKNDPKPTLYLGTKSGAEILEYGGVNVGNQWYTGSPTVLTDNYLDFDVLFSNIKSQSKNLSSSGKTVKPKDGKVEISIGDKVIIDEFDKVKEINIKGDKSSNNLTLINVKKSGKVNMPTVTINGNQVSTQDSDATGNAIVWNIPNATSVQMASSPSIGHIVAPSANVSTGDTNYAGCMIANSLTGHIEGHS